MKVIGKGYAIRPTGWSPRGAGAKVLAGALAKVGLSRREVAYIVGDWLRAGVIDI